MRRSRSDIERLVLDAAVDLVRTDGLGTGAEGITYTRVFRHLEATTGHRVTRASVHERVWSDQAAFQAAVRDRIAGLPDSSTVGTGVRVEELLAALVRSSSTSSVLADGVRGVDDVVGRTEERALHQARLAFKAVLALSNDDERSRAAVSVAAFREAQRHRVAVLARAYGRLVRELGGAVRPETGLDHDAAILLVARSVDALREGLELAGPFEAADPSGVPTDCDDPAPWPITSIVGYHLLHGMFEFPEFSPNGAVAPFAPSVASSELSS